MAPQVGLGISSRYSAKVVCFSPMNSTVVVMRIRLVKSMVPVLAKDSATD